MYEPNRMFLSLKSLHKLNICPMAHLKYIFYGGESCDIYVPPPKVREDILVPVRIPGVGVGVTVCIHHISRIYGGILPNLHGYIIGTS